MLRRSRSVLIVWLSRYVVGAFIIQLLTFRLLWSAKREHAQTRSLPWSRPTTPVRRIEAVEDYEFALPRYLIALFFCLAGSVIACGRHARDAERAALLKHAARLFEDLSLRPQNTIPDAVLNRTRCVAIIPTIPAGTGHLSRRGVATCREPSDHWNAPAFITFEENGDSKRGADLLIFILKDAGVRALRSGRLEIQKYWSIGSIPVFRTSRQSQLSSCAKV